MQRAPPAGKRQTLIGLQYLRGIAALMVAYYHMTLQIPSLSVYVRRYLFGYSTLASGVDLFFVISGFIMLLTTENTTPRTFLRRRLIRIVPLYWIVTLSVAGAAALRPEIFNSTRVNLKSIAKSLLFIPYVNTAFHRAVVPILIPGWSLNLEMFFYAIFALVLLCASLTGRLLLCAAIFLSLVAVHYAIFDTNHPVLQFLTQFRLLEFWFGMLLARLYSGRAFLSQRPALWWGISGLALLTLVLAPLPYAGQYDGGIVVFTTFAAPLLVLGVVALDRHGAIPRFPPLLHLGDASYSMYLSHLLFLGICRLAWSRQGLPVDSTLAAAGFAILSMATVVAASLLVYRLIEKPITDCLRRLYKPAALL